MDGFEPPQPPKWDPRNDELLAAATKRFAKDERHFRLLVQVLANFFDVSLKVIKHRCACN
jgi:hypothetical protein